MLHSGTFQWSVKYIRVQRWLVLEYKHLDRHVGAHDSEYMYYLYSRTGILSLKDQGRFHFTNRNISLNQ